MHLRFAVGAALFAGAVAAQQEIVTPIAMTNAYGGANNAIPWGVPVPSTAQGEVFCQQIESDLMGTPRLLKGFAFRHNYVSTYAAKTYMVTVKIGDAASGPAGISTTFASNWKMAGAQTTVFSGTVTFPAVPAYPRPPAPPDSPLRFTAPHISTGLDPLLWEGYITNTSPSTPMHFHECGPGTTHVAGVIGNGCTVSGGTNPMASSGYITLPGLMMDTLTFGPANSVGFLMMGDTTARLLGLIQLPLDLAPMGSPGCALEINMLHNFPMATSASGGAAFFLPFMPDPVPGMRLRTQWFAIDSQNRVRTSNGLDHSIPYSAAAGRPYPQNRVYASGFGPTPPPTGAIQNNGIVTHWML